MRFAHGQRRGPNAYVNRSDVNELRRLHTEGHLEHFMISNAVPEVICLGQASSQQIPAGEFTLTPLVTPRLITHLVSARIVNNASAPGKKFETGIYSLKFEDSNSVNLVPGSKAVFDLSETGLLEKTIAGCKLDSSAFYFIGTLATNDGAELLAIPTGGSSLIKFMGASGQASIPGAITVSTSSRSVPDALPLAAYLTSKSRQYQ